MALDDADTRGLPRYTHGHEVATLASHGTRTAANSCAYLLPVLEPGMSLLDVGCGPGTITLDLAQLVAPGQVVGLENVEAPLISARSRAKERGDTLTRFEVGDALHLPFEDDTFDVVHAHQVLQHLPDPVLALQEMARVCRAGGWVAVRDADYAAMAWHPASPELEEWRTLYRAVARANDAEPDAARHLRAWALAAGLHEVSFTATAWNYADAETCQWWGESQAVRYGGQTFAEQAARQGATAESLDRIVAGWRAWGGAPDAWFMIPNGELLARIT
ncbi:methyltransferase domain-containing protein [Ornithinimicrobium faecis]|uniref:methyltransferase domain-containing protein n=1 Tax=Ornithinimicrobium faecis TaxID=2934158 RepID=UPI0021185F2C|nr:methyltransferase domain-containing protein [Ornithinimicrobium sp. HY1745]